MDNIAVVILNYNGEGHLKRFLPSVFQNSDDAIIYVVDNGSTDDSLKLIKGQFPSIRIIEFEKNLGYAGGYAKALQQISAKYYVLLNSDVEVTSGWLHPMFNFMESHHDCAAVQPKILSYSRKTHFEYAGAAGGFLDIFGYPYCRGRIFDTVEKDNGQYDTVEEIFWGSGCSLFVRADDYHSVGGLDPIFFAHMEEIDLCWRFWRNGKDVNYIPQSVVFHLGGGTLPIESPMKTKLNFRNSAFCLLKNLPGKKVWALVYLKLVLDAVAFLYFIFKGRFTHAKSLWKGHREFFLLSRVIWKKRINLKQEVPKRIIKKNCIAWTYFIKKKKYFSDFKV